MNREGNNKEQKKKVNTRKAPRRRVREPKWDKLDNTAHLFPVIEIGRAHV